MPVFRVKPAPGKQAAVTATRPGARTLQKLQPLGDPPAHKLPSPPTVREEIAILTWCLAIKNLWVHT